MRALAHPQQCLCFSRWVFMPVGSWCAVEDYAHRGHEHGDLQMVCCSAVQGEGAGGM
jgi:hypothetical protein